MLDYHAHTVYSPVRNMRAGVTRDATFRIGFAECVAMDHCTHDLFDFSYHYHNSTEYADSVEREIVVDGIPSFHKRQSRQTPIARRTSHARRS